MNSIFLFNSILLKIIEIRVHVVRFFGIHSWVAYLVFSNWMRHSLWKLLLENYMKQYKRWTIDMWILFLYWLFCIRFYFVWFIFFFIHRYVLSIWMGLRCRNVFPFQWCRCRYSNRNVVNMVINISSLHFICGCRKLIIIKMEHLFNNNLYIHCWMNIDIFHN